MKQYFVYIMTNKKDEVLYIGVTNDLVKRVFQHKNKMIDGFTKKYNINILVYYENHGSIEQAIIRERQMKKWRRDWKINLIMKNNPDWRDLYDGLV